MEVIKKSGRVQTFSRDKIETSVRNAGLDIKEHLSEADIRLITDDVVKTLHTMRGDDGKTSVYEIRILAALAIKQFGYEKIAKHYFNGMIDN